MAGGFVDLLHVCGVTTASGTAVAAGGGGDAPDDWSGATLRRKSKREGYRVVVPEAVDAAAALRFTIRLEASARVLSLTGSADGMVVVQEIPEAVLASARGTVRIRLQAAQAALYAVRSMSAEGAALAVRMAAEPVLDVSQQEALIALGEWDAVL